MDNSTAADILIIEDNPEDAELIIRALKKRRLANDIFIINDGRKALDFIHCQGEYANRNLSAGPKVIFLDLKLPKVNGLEVLKALKAEITTKYIPVIIITSSREDPDIKAAYEQGVNSYIVKPVNFKVFMDAMEHTGYYWLLINRTLP